MVLNRTIFYSEGGGQISDTWWLTKGTYRVEVVDVQSVEGVLLHEIKGKISLERGDTVSGRIDWERRLNLMRSHSATHLLLGAARRVLGNHAWQAGAQ